ncbi:sensor histidine kinase KdpD [Bacillus sp. S/N-304-OC-R1]|uniref:sensor histidine kinase n=1 Tax=Bacillus sp. S/N-304-OC-R1 TaxID=2758034 RepID=UPI001C8D9059|nr:HAMP domain-containing sensor histidine kinase [Bacillus sp. S/N-304-OC-R1]MBY0122030.1 HAMP domain-containing histidine kinase [Bacillus sp. S/N-304-OC-R1]
MLRNKEIQLIILCLSLVALTGSTIAFFLSITAAFLVLITSILIIGISLWFTRWRYREIEKLSGYLRQISSGNYSLDVRDNREGELSILKNDIYKVTLMLSEQSTLLQKDKVRLMNAISDISHQLKTPLTSMVVMADLLSEPNLPNEKREEFTQNILTQLERIEWLVSSLLKLSKIDAGTVHFKKDEIDAAALIKKALQPMLIPMDIKEQKLTINGEKNVTFIGDLNWTTEAFINLFKNCVEHTRNGGHISISLNENALFTEIKIADNGKGIPREDLPYIFKRFYKGKNAGEDNVGIGLAMAHSIISNQNGVIDVKSQEGKGTEFTIKFYKQII